MKKDRPILAGSGGVLGALRQRHANDPQRAPSYAFFTEVSDATGGQLNRYADAIVMSLWPSRGLTLSGFEVKVSRSDWTRELVNPAKCEPIFRFCDYWWIAVSDETIVKDGELPPTWGLLVPDRKGGLRIHTSAPKLTPEPITRGFLAAILRRAMQQGADQTAIAAERERAKKEAEASAASKYRFDLDEFAALKKKVATFEKAAGLSIDQGWPSPSAIGDAVRQVLRGPSHVQSLRRLHEDATRIASEIDKAVTAHEAAEPARKV